MKKLAKYTEKLDVIEACADDATEKLALAFRRKVLIPFCKKNKLTFVAGLFIKENGEELYGDPPLEDFDKICSFLDKTHLDRTVVDWVLDVTEGCIR